MIAEPPAFPKALDDDEDDVAWALQTAAVQWERGGHTDAVLWLRRAAESAVEAGHFERAADLQRGARQVELWVERAAGPVPDEEDGVDSLLNAAEAPLIEAGEVTGPSPSLVDVLEAEARGELLSAPPPQFNDVTDVGDLGDMVDVEDIEADDVVDLSEDPAFQPEPATVAVDSSRRAAQWTVPETDVPPVYADAGGYAYVEETDEVTVPPPSSSQAKLPPLPRPPQQRPPKPASRIPPPPEPLPEEPAPSAPPPATLDEAAAVSVEIDQDVPPLSAPAEPAPVSVRLRSEPPFEATLVDARPAGGPLAESSLPPMMEAPYSESTLLDARGPDQISDSPLPDESRPPEPAHDTAPAAARSDTAPPATNSGAPGGVSVELLASCRGLEDLPPETQAELAARATLERLAPEQEVSGFGLAIVAEGEVLVMPTIAEAACGLARKGEPVFSRGNLAEGVPLRAVATAQGAAVAVLRSEDFEQMLVTCPWVAEELRSVADRFQALAGVAMGPLGERLDDAMRAMVTDRCEVRLLEAGDVLLEEGTPVPGLHVVGGGRLEAVRGGAPVGELLPGDLAFGSSVLSHEKAPATLRAAAGGALVVVADRMTTHELLVSVPPLLELLATA
jgi:CRP-like cAMP-binding protein